MSSTSRVHRPVGTVGICGSAGAIEGLIHVVRGLPAAFPLPIVVAVHLPARERFASQLPRILAYRGALQAVWAAHGERPRAGSIHVAPQDCVTTVDMQGRLCVKPSRSTMCPRANPLLESLAAYHGDSAIGVVLSGMLTDGAVGAQAVEAAGGVVIVQDRATSPCFSMPGAAIERGAAHHVMPLRRIPHVLVALTMATGARAWLNVARDSLYQVTARACELRGAAATAAAVAAATGRRA